jgi:hypothetical protein
MLYIDIIEHCNFACYFCGAKDLDKRTYMDYDLYTRIIDQAVELGVTTVSLTPLLGEPFLHPRIYDILAYTLDRLELVTLDTNASAIDIGKLQQVYRDNLQIKVSQYGRSVDEFVKLTNAPPRLHGIFVQKLAELSAAGINVRIRMREIDHAFNCEETRDQFPIHDISTKCKFHMVPQIFPNGDIAFCRFVRDSVGDRGDRSKASFANLNITPLADAVSDPLRYKFYDSQSICATFCRSAYCSAGDATFVSYKLMAQSKQKYNTTKELTDQRYAKFEHDCLQSS